ncbi:hypothetical protein [Paenibacillus alvei]|uniref:hypothetical protein n=1 Tax=Paenibacillus alvei TaxID=44250 RepID=UPI0003863C6D|nr:hypothetical protein [Paenibacillus alvei]EPY11935.1 hypothetical protein PAAL66ix_15507 [Paenibacillus alvei A6-6i-x]
MQVNDGQLDEFLLISKHRLVSHYQVKLLSCLQCTSPEMLWDQESEGENCIGSIVLHIIAHVDRNTKRLSNPDTRFNQGIETHFPNEPMSKLELIARVTESFEALGVAIDQSHSKNHSSMYDLYHLVEHTAYHSGQVIDRVQRRIGTRFQFVQQGLNEKALRQRVENELEVRKAKNTAT